MPTLYLVRHGEYSNPRTIIPGRLPVELSDVGQLQAEKLRDYFADKQISKIFSSAVLRSKQTAEIIANGRTVIYDQRLLETLSAYQGYWGPNTHPGGFHFLSHQAELGGESMADVYARQKDFWDEVSLTLTGDVIVVGHGDPLACLYEYLEGRPPHPDNAPESQIKGYLAKGEYLAVPF